MNTTVIITRNVNSIAVEAKKGQTFEAVAETTNSFKILVDGKIRMISKKFAKIQEVTKTQKRKGVIQTIIENLKGGSKTKEMLLKILVEEFPERTSDGMFKTLNAQLGFGKGKETRIEREQSVKLNVARTEDSLLFSLI